MALVTIATTIAEAFGDVISEYAKLGFGYLFAATQIADLAGFDLGLSTVLTEMLTVIGKVAAQAANFVMDYVWDLLSHSQLLMNAFNTILNSFQDQINRFTCKGLAYYLNEFGSSITSWTNEAKLGILAMCGALGEKFDNIMTKLKEMFDDWTDVDREILAKAAEADVFDPADDVLAVKTGQYIHYWDGDPLNPPEAQRKHTLLKTFNTPNVDTEVSGNTIRGMAVLKEGDDDWGFIHGKNRHWNEIASEFGISTDEELTQMIKKTLEEGEITQYIEGDRITMSLEFETVSGGKRYFDVGITDRTQMPTVGRGTIITFRPGNEVG